MKRLLLVFVLLLSCFNIFANDFFIIDGRNKKIVFDKPVSKIVSMTPAITEMVASCGSIDKLIGVTEFCNFPDAVKRIRKIGGYSSETISIETILMLKPDVVFGERTQIKLANSLESYGIKTVILDDSSFDKILSSMLDVGKICGKDFEIKSIVNGIQSRLDKIKCISMKIPMDKRKTVFWEVFDEPLMSAGKETFINQVISFCGGINIFGESETAWPMVSFESLLQKNPDFILSPYAHSSSVSLDIMSKRQGWSSLKAIKNGNVFTLDSDMSSRPGPRFIDILEIVSKILYPEYYK